MSDENHDSVSISSSSSSSSSSSNTDDIISLASIVAQANHDIELDNIIQVATTTTTTLSLSGATGATVTEGLQLVEAEARLRAGAGIGIGAVSTSDSDCRTQSLCHSLSVSLSDNSTSSINDISSDSSSSAAAPLVMRQRRQPRQPRQGLTVSAKGLSLGDEDSEEEESDAIIAAADHVIDHSDSELIHGRQGHNHHHHHHHRRRRVCIIVSVSLFIVLSSVIIAGVVQLYSFLSDSDGITVSLSSLSFPQYDIDIDTLSRSSSSSSSSSSRTSSLSYCSDMWSSSISLHVYNPTDLDIEISSISFHVSDDKMISSPVIVTVSPHSSSNTRSSSSSLSSSSSSSSSSSFTLETGHDAITLDCRIQFTNRTRVRQWIASNMLYWYRKEYTRMRPSDQSLKSTGLYDHLYSHSDSDTDTDSRSQSQSLDDIIQLTQLSTTSSIDATIYLLGIIPLSKTITTSTQWNVTHAPTPSSSNSDDIDVKSSALTSEAEPVFTLLQWDHTRFFVHAHMWLPTLYAIFEPLFDTHHALENVHIGIPTWTLKAGTQPDTNDMILSSQNQTVSAYRQPQQQQQQAQQQQAQRNIRIDQTMSQPFPGVTRQTPRNELIAADRSLAEFTLDIMRHAAQNSSTPHSLRLITDLLFGNTPFDEDTCNTVFYMTLRVASEVNQYDDLDCFFNFIMPEVQLTPKAYENCTNTTTTTTTTSSNHSHKLNDPSASTSVDSAEMGQLLSTFILDNLIGLQVQQPLEDYTRFDMQFAFDTTGRNYVVGSIPEMSFVLAADGYDAMRINMIWNELTVGSSRAQLTFAAHNGNRNGNDNDNVGMSNLLDALINTNRSQTADAGAGAGDDGDGDQPASLRRVLRLHTFTTNTLFDHMFNLPASETNVTMDNNVSRTLLDILTNDLFPPETFQLAALPSQPVPPSGLYDSMNMLYKRSYTGWGIAGYPSIDIKDIMCSIEADPFGRIRDNTRSGPTQVMLQLVRLELNTNIVKSILTQQDFTLLAAASTFSNPVLEPWLHKATRTFEAEVIRYRRPFDALLSWYIAGHAQHLSVRCNFGTLAAHGLYWWTPRVASFVQPANRTAVAYTLSASAPLELKFIPPLYFGVWMNIHSVELRMKYQCSVGAGVVVDTPIRVVCGLGRGLGLGRVRLDVIDAVQAPSPVMLSIAQMHCGVQLVNANGQHAAECLQQVTNASSQLVEGREHTLLWDGAAIRINATIDVIDRLGPGASGIAQQQHSFADVVFWQKL
jgi:hypothetical protein